MNWHWKCKLGRYYDSFHYNFINMVNVIVLFVSHAKKLCNFLFKYTSFRFIEMQICRVAIDNIYCISAIAQETGQGMLINFQMDFWNMKEEFQRLKNFFCFQCETDKNCKTLKYDVLNSASPQVCKFLIWHDTEINIYIYIYTSILINNFL